MERRSFLAALTGLVATGRALLHLPRTTREADPWREPPYDPSVLMRLHVPNGTVTFQRGSSAWSMGRDGRWRLAS